ncbi:hypothetical protein [Sphaerisporangium dianthi]|uniref:Uncharacterized protein n=1 Tax=Sphaerisporangium dianthi TaxID=1436120 RepID=A0ABV9CH88_9ACTN
MGTTDSLAGHLRARARWRLDRVQTRDGDWNARCALALLDAAAYTQALPADDPLITALEDSGCFGAYGCGDFEPGEAVAKLIDSWHDGDPWELLTAIPAAARADGLPSPR